MTIANEIAISIHALREESDMAKFCINMEQIISIHALREESDCTSLCRAYASVDFNPRSPWGERPDSDVALVSLNGFQSTLSVRRATKDCKKPKWQTDYFNPRSPWGERQQNFWVDTLWHFISIHALREESDDECLSKYSQRQNFNPRSPWGERQRIGIQSIMVVLFQSTLSVRRATV